MRADKRRARFGQAYRARQIIEALTLITPLIRHMTEIIRDDPSSLVRAMLGQPVLASRGYHETETLGSAFPPSITVGHDRMLFIPHVAHPEAPTLAELTGPDVIDISAYIRDFRPIALPESGPSSARLNWGNLTYTYDAIESGPSPLEALLAAARNRRGLDSYYEERDDDIPYDWTDAQRVRSEDYDNTLDHIDHALDGWRPATSIAHPDTPIDLTNGDHHA